LLAFSAHTKGGPNQVFQLFPMVKKIFLSKGGIAQCLPKYATGLDETLVSKIRIYYSTLNCSTVPITSVNYRTLPSYVLSVKKTTLQSIYTLL
jgi:hypothetical protein